MINKEEQKEMEARQNSTEVPLIEAVDLKPENCLRKSDSKNCRSANQIKLKYNYPNKKILKAKTEKQSREELIETVFPKMQYMRLIQLLEEQ